jgi:hypothetical protein
MLKVKVIENKKNSGIVSEVFPSVLLPEEKQSVYGGAPPCSPKMVCPANFEIIVCAIKQITCDEKFKLTCTDFYFALV